MKKKNYINNMRFLIYTFIIYAVFFTELSYAKLTPDEEKFLKKIETSEKLTKNRLILKGPQLEKIKVPMGHTYKKRIFTYWKTDSNKTLWILNSIGKYKPITAAFLVDKCKINSAHVLTYREQHGYEIKYPSFLSQFVSVGVDDKLDLTEVLDNISGATLSVNSMDRMARTAVILDSISNENKC